jgi:hypothetical protein
MVKTQLLMYFITLGDMLAAFYFSFLTHFGLMQINGVLNSLVTDSNYLETRIVWQTLDGVCYSVFFIIYLCDCELVAILSFGLSGQR